MAAPTRERTTWETVKRVLKPVASLQLTVALFALSIVLVFFGTLALIDNGMWSVIHSYFKSFVVKIRFDLVRKFLSVFFLPSLQKVSPWPGWLPFPGGVTIGLALFLNLVAAHVVRFKLSWKRAGIILLHTGVIVLLLGELATRFFAVEATMTLKVGEASNHVDVSDSAELAFIDSSDPTMERVAAISHDAIVRAFENKTSERIQNADLPVDVRVDEYYRNTDLDPIRPVDAIDVADRVVRGTSGAVYVIKPHKESSGVDSEQRDNAVSARVTFFRKGADEVLGSAFVSCWFDRNFTRRQLQAESRGVTVDGKRFGVELRPKRVYKPYTIALLKFEHDLYPGTDKPKDFASTVRLVHPERKEDREVRIWMNNPLRYDANLSEGFLGLLETLNPVWNESETFYQAGFLPDDSGTVLQVVRNPSWLLPYISCGMVFFGMVTHFLIVLIGFLGKWTRPVRGTEVVKPRRGPWPFVAAFGLALVFVGYVGSKARPAKPATDGPDLVGFGTLPVQEGGRVQPLDSFARNTLLAVSARSDFDSVFDQEGKADPETKPAIRWLLDVMGTNDPFGCPGAKYKVIRIESDQLLGELELPRRPGFYRYSPTELKPKFEWIQTEYEKARQVDAKNRTLLQTKVFDLGSRMALYLRIVFMRAPHTVPPQADGDKWQAVGAIDMDNARPVVAGKMEELIREIEAELAKQGKRIEDLPPARQAELQDKVDEFRSKWVREAADALRPTSNPAAEAFVQLLRAGRGDDAAAFNQKLNTFRDNYLGHVAEKDSGRVRTEAWLNNFDPLFQCAGLFVFVGLLTGAAWLAWPYPKVRTGFWLSAVLLAVLAAGIETATLILRMYLMDRPLVFVTNLYSSAVFIGWAVTLVGLVLELFFRIGIGSMVVAVLGFGTTFIARYLEETNGDTLELLQAVLDTNLWLASHVTTIALGYATTLVAGLIALLYLTLGIGTPLLRGTPGKAVGYMLYGVLCVATLLSFVGTVLGGIWADQSWGRFWGWDPKENGALLIVAWNALILHARWCGLVKVRGTALLAVAGIGVTMWSWFGTNQLGIGLHAYGFNTTLATWCKVIWIGVVGVVAVALAVPRSAWRSADPLPTAPPARATRVG
jgi:ABC-type transport system involved in cytochrome c biogenesis permease subunit